MQIHELTQPTLTEAGVLQGIKSAAQGAVQGYQQSKQARQDRADQQGIQNVSDRAVKAWTQYAKQLKASNPDPVRYAELYKQALMAFVQKNLLKGQPIANAINKQEITQLINAMSDQADNPTAITNLFPKLVQQAATSVTDVNSGAGQLQVKVINPDPAVLQFRNKTYIINDQGEWADQTTKAVADQSFQAFLDQELAKAVPNAKQQLTPQTQQKIEYLAPNPQWKNLDGVRGFQGKIMFKDKAGKWFDYNNNQPTEETRPEYIDQLNKLYDQVRPAGSGQPQDANAVLQQAGIDTAKLAQLQAAIKADPAVADQLRKTLGL
jgi:hypothetical protein